MIKSSLLFLYFLFLSYQLSAQAVKITERKVEKILDKIELYGVDIVEVKTLKKWKALNLSRDMKSQMDYNVVRVKYRTNDIEKTVLFDMHLVPIRYNYLDLAEK